MAAKGARKTHKGAQKRMTVSSTGKIKHAKTNKGHLMTGKRGKKVRQLRNKGVMSEGKIAANYRVLLNV